MRLTLSHRTTHVDHSYGTEQWAKISWIDETEELLCRGARHFGRCLLRDTRLEQVQSRSVECQLSECPDSHCPSKADRGQKRVEYQRKDNAADARAHEDDACCETSSPIKPLAEIEDDGSQQNTASSSEEDTLKDNEHGDRLGEGRDENRQGAQDKADHDHGTVKVRIGRSETSEK